MSDKATLAEIAEMMGLNKPRPKLSQRAEKPKEVLRTQSNDGLSDAKCDVTETVGTVKPPAGSKYTAVEFKTPLDLLLTLNPHVIPYKWQGETLRQLAGYFAGEDGPRAEISDRDPLFYNLCAANGSGKDAFIIAPFAIWFCVAQIRARCIITSSGYDQLKGQTWSYIKTLADAFNDFVGGKVLEAVEFHIHCVTTGSEIKCFRTDEAGKAEGFHPFPDYPGAKMAFIANEAKSIEDPLWQAFSRYTGYSHWIEISSPAARAGHFYKTSTADNVVTDVPKLKGTRFFRRVTAFECPHITDIHIDEIVRDCGESSSLYQSSVLALFTDIDSDNIIKESDYEKCLLNPPTARGHEIVVGLDLAAGGDETVGVVRRGNVIVHKFYFRQQDTELAADIIDTQLRPWKDSPYKINADDGGIGRGIIDKLVSRGWKVVRHNNQSPARNKRLYLNHGAEMYYKLMRLIQRRDIVLPTEEKFPKLKFQLTTRNQRGLDSTQGKIALESKRDARAAGRPSPDRGDAFVLCFMDYKESAAAETVKKPDQKRIASIAAQRKFWADADKVQMISDQWENRSMGTRQPSRQLYSILN